MRGLVPLVLFLAAALPAAAQQVIADLSQSRVAITTSFSGSSILVFGTVRENTPMPHAPFDVIVTVSGPLEPVTIRKKSRVAGIWINTEAVELSQAPTLYRVATSRPLNEILSQTEDLRHSISVERAIRSVGATAAVADAAPFVEALIRVHSRDGTYRISEGGITIISDTLFRTDIDLPSNLTEGNYHARIFMIRDKRVIASFSDEIHVRKVGIERWIFLLAQEQSLIYGLMSLAIAIAAGWGASAVFRYIRS